MIELIYFACLCQKTIISHILFCIAVQPASPDEEVKLGGKVKVLPRPRILNTPHPQDGRLPRVHSNTDDVDPRRDPGRGPLLPREGGPDIPGIIITPPAPGENFLMGDCISYVGHFRPCYLMQAGVRNVPFHIMYYS